MNYAIGLMMVTLALYSDKETPIGTLSFLQNMIGRDEMLESWEKEIADNWQVFETAYKNGNYDKQEIYRQIRNLDGWGEG